MLAADIFGVDFQDLETTSVECTILKHELDDALVDSDGRGCLDCIIPPGYLMTVVFYTWSISHLDTASVCRVWCTLPPAHHVEVEVGFPEQVFFFCFFCGP